MFINIRTQTGGMKKLLLLNPPGKKIYIRDYYCSKVSKTNYIYHPVDLLVLSSRLYGKYDLKVIDAISERIPAKDCLKLIVGMNPDIIIFQSGSVSLEEDFPFLSEVKKNLKTVQLLGSGDVFNENGVELMKEQGWLDAIILDFTTDDTLKYLEGQEPNNMIYRKDGQIIETKLVREKWTSFELPVPRHELFQKGQYRYPFVRNYPFATVLGDYGCAWRCNFCIMSQIGFKIRSIDSVLAELRYLKQLGVKEIYWDDQTFGANKKRADELLNRMIDEKLDFGWVCFSRGDVVNVCSIDLWKRAGCHTIMFGVESGVQEILNAQKKDITKDQLRQAFVLCKKKGIRRVGTFILGLPQDTYESCLETIQFAKELDCDYAAFNTLVPRMGTVVRKESVEHGFIDKSVREMDQSGTFVVMKNEALSADQIHELHRLAIRTFYLRPSYVVKRLLGIKTFDDFKGHVTDAVSLVKNFITSE